MGWGFMIPMDIITPWDKSEKPEKFHGFSCSATVDHRIQDTFVIFLRVGLHILQIRQ